MSKPREFWIFSYCDEYAPYGKPGFKQEPGDIHVREVTPIDDAKDFAIERAQQRIHSDICAGKCVSECLELYALINPEGNADG